MNTLSPDEQLKLIERARQVAANAYVPHSHFRVGAAVLGERGTYAGANVENASFGLGHCAERSALSAAVAAGDRKIRAIAVACIDADTASAPDELMPCGACRQWILELAKDAVILIARPDGSSESVTISDLLPKPFRLIDKRERDS